MKTRLRLLFVMPPLVMNVAILLAPHAVQAQCSPPPPGIVAWWPGNGSALDVVGGNNGTLTNGVTYVQGEVGLAFNFNSNSAMVIVGNPASLQLQNFTVEAWVKRASATVATTDPTVGNASGSLFDYGHNGYAFGLFADGTLLLSQVDASYVDSSAALTDTNWHHVAVTADSGSVVFYVDGVAYPATSAYNPSYQFTTPAAIGGRPDNVNGNNNGSFFGSIDEMSIYNRGLSSNEVAAIYNAGAVGKCLPAGDCAPSSQGLISWWPANGNALDIFGGNNGALENGVTFAPGEVGQAFEFNGSDQSVVIPDSPSLELTNTITIEAWVNLATLTDDPNGPGRGIVSKVGGAEGDFGYQFGFIHQTLFGIFNSPGQVWPQWTINSPALPSLATGVWMHVAWTYDQNTMLLYLNGQPIATNVIGPHPIATSDAHLRLSGDDNGNVMFDGLIDEATIYDRALSPGEIAAIYDAGSAGKCLPSPTLAPGISGTNFCFSVPTISNLIYTIQQNTDLATTNWVFYTNFTGNGSLFQFVTPILNIPRQFFRVSQ